jgi:xylono-1,5-lactonase
MTSGEKGDVTCAMPALGPVACVWNRGALLGEGAVWSPSEQALYWVDILGRAVHRLAVADGQRSSWAMPQEVSALAERRQGSGWVLALRQGLALWDPASPEQAPAFLCRPEPDQPGNRLNDGKCDALGRFWVGSMDFDCQQPTGALYCVRPDGSAARRDHGFAVTNGPTWLLDRRTMLFNDTVNGRVLAYDFDEINGQLSRRRVWLQLAEGDGLPDGMCTVAAGRVWICHWGGNCVSCHDPDNAREIGRISLPVSQVTSCAFGGADMRTLFVTSARVGLPPDALLREPLAGGLFMCQVGEPGRAAHLFAG